MKDIGRNAPCPCGSGKKHKRCHGIEGAQPASAQAMPDKHFLSAFDTTDLVKTFAALTILPENHGKNLRLENLITQAIEYRAGSRAIVTVDALQRYVAKFQADNPMEERPVTLFTENVVHEMGNNIIFPGITESGSFMLENLLSAVFHVPDTNLPADFVNEMRKASLLLLRLSHTIARRMGYRRYQLANPSGNQIFFPDQEKMEKAKQAVTITEEEMSNILRRFDVDKDLFNKFLLNPKIFKIDDEGNSPILHQPIFANGIDFTIASPATLSLALTDFIWTEASKRGLMENVNQAYHRVIWNNTNMYLRQLGFTLFGHPDIQLVSGETRREALYKIDDDKIAVIYYVFDDGRNYDDPRGANLHIQELSARRNALAKEILEIPDFKDHKILDLIIYSRIGRDLMLAYMRNEQAESLCFNPFDIAVLAEAKNVDAIDLWNFACATKEMTKENGKITLPYLDLFQLYRDQGDGLYLSENHKTFQFAHFGDSVKLIQEAMLRKDEHAEPAIYQGQQVWVPVRKNGPYAPIYMAPMEIAEQLVFYLKCLPVPLNISPAKPRAEIKATLRDIYWQITDAFAYWIWQSASFLAHHVTALPIGPISVQFELLDEDKFENIARDYKRQPGLSDQFIVKADERLIRVAIPAAILPYLYGADNEGERVLLAKIIEGFSKLLAINGLPEIPADEIAYIINEAAPLSNKKKFYLVDSGNTILLDTHKLVERRYIQRYNSNTIRRSFVKGLDKKCPPVGISTDSKLQTKTSFSVVLNQLLPRLRVELIKYNSNELLKKLLGLNESLIWKRERMKMDTPTRIACFVSVGQHSNDLQRELSELSRTSVAVRCLIEHIVAEPSTGNAVISDTAIDELVAIMDLIVEWGGIGDIAINELFGLTLEVTEDGWIDFRHEEFDEVLEPYTNKKIMERVTDAEKAFESAFPTGDEAKSKDVPQFVDDAFSEEVGISFSRICGFINALGVIAYQQPAPYATLSKKELLVQINKIERAFSNDEYEAALSYLALWNRGKVDNTAGFENFDISPWRMNRRLSLLSRPVCLIDNHQDKDDPQVFWGLRQVVSSRTYLFEQCATNRLRSKDGGPISAATTRVNQEFNNGLVDAVETRLKAPGLIMDRDKFIGPGSKFFFQHKKDIGDIDVMIIDPQEKVLYSLECKNLAPSRNFKEMVEEVNRMFDERMLDKHAVRHEWIKANLNQFEEKYGVDLSAYTVKSFFVTAEGMLTPHLKNKVTPVPIISLYDIDEKGLDALK